MKYITCGPIQFIRMDGELLASAQVAVNMQVVNVAMRVNTTTKKGYPYADKMLPTGDYLSIVVGNKCVTALEWIAQELKQLACHTLKTEQQSGFYFHSRRFGSVENRQLPIVMTRHLVTNYFLECGKIVWRLDGK